MSKENETKNHKHTRFQNLQKIHLKQPQTWSQEPQRTWKIYPFSSLYLSQNLFPFILSSFIQTHTDLSFDSNLGFRSGSHLFLYFLDNRFGPPFLIDHNPSLFSNLMLQIYHFWNWSSIKKIMCVCLCCVLRSQESFVPLPLELPKPLWSVTDLIGEWTENIEFNLIAPSMVRGWS